MIERVEPATARSVSPLPMLLSFVAGYVDSYTYLTLFGLFAAQVTGSFVIAGAEFVSHDYGITGKLLAVLAFVAAGALTAAIIGLLRQSERRTLPLMLALEASLLAAFGGMMVFGRPVEGAGDPYGIVAGLLAAMAMGTQSVLVRLLMRGIPQTNVMTGNMTQLAIEITELITAWRRKARDPTDRHTGEFAAVRKRLWIVLSVAIGFVVGAATGAIAYATTRLIGVLLAPALVATLAIAAVGLE
jgi:uncharacterized membrane protein YoaK (UPF0700 family)